MSLWRVNYTHAKDDELLNVTTTFMPYRQALAYSKQLETGQTGLIVTTLELEDESGFNCGFWKRDA